MAAGADRGRERGQRQDEAQQRVFRRRRRVALGITAACAVLLIWGVSSLLGGGSDSGRGGTARLELPRGGRTILPRHRVVSYYGAPQDPQLGILGAVPPGKAAQKLLARARNYERPQRPVLPAFELIAAIARAAPGEDGLYRLRQTSTVIRRYLAAVRRIKGLLILDIQPGHADFLGEVVALEPYLTEPDVGLALDSEWSVPPGTVPGQAIGSTDAATINRISAYLSALVRKRGLPQKLLIVHQFTEGMVKERERVVSRAGVAIVFNVDGFGAPHLKSAIYDRLIDDDTGRHRASRHFSGLKLFFDEDTTLMSDHDVLGLRPRPDIVVYE